MRSIFWRGLLVVSALLVATPAWAQSEPRILTWAVRGHAQRARSSDADAIGWTIGIAMWHSQNFNPNGTPKPVEAPPMRQLELLFSLHVGHEVGGGFMSEYLGGVRSTNTTLFKWPAYIEVLGGAQHFSGSTNGVLHADVGLVFGDPTRSMQFFVQGGIPVFFFPGNAEIGMEVGAGLRFGGRK